MKIPTFSYFFDLSYYLTPCTPPLGKAGTPQQGRHLPGEAGTPLAANPPARQAPPWHGDPPNQQTATAVDGTHPTGMHSYISCVTYGLKSIPHPTAFAPL